MSVTRKLSLLVTYFFKSQSSSQGWFNISALYTHIHTYIHAHIYVHNRVEIIVWFFFLRILILVRKEELIICISSYLSKSVACYNDPKELLVHRFIVGIDGFYSFNRYCYNSLIFTNVIVKYIFTIWIK